MSLNQSRSDNKSESHFRKPGGGRSGNNSGGQQRSFSGGGRGRGGGRGPSNTAPSLSTGGSYKKTNNVQAVQSRGTLGAGNTSDSHNASGARSVENGGHVQATLHGVSNPPAPASIPKPSDSAAQKSSRPLPRAPSSQSSTPTSDSTPSTPAKEGAKGFSLQFGSISPGFMNGMQVPARTSSAPPNLDEQKRDQARRDATRPVPEIPLPSAPKQEIPKKKTSNEQTVTQDTNMESKAKRDVQVASASPPTQAHKAPALPMPGISMQLPYHQPTVSMQFGGPNPQIQSQGMATSSLQMPIQMPLHMGNPAQVPQQVYMPSLQHHIMQTQGIMHQGQNIGFNPQLGPQLPHQLGNMGMNMSPQFNQQQAGKLASTRKTVKITHPDTHEELRLDNRDGGSSGSRSHHTGPSQSQPLPTYSATPTIGYFPNSYTASPPFYPAQSSLPLTSPQLTASSPAPRFNYPVSQAPPAMSFVNQSPSNSFPVSKGGASMHGSPDSISSDYARDAQKIVPSAPSAQSTLTSVSVKAAGGSVGEKVRASPAVSIAEPPKPLSPAVEPGAVRKELDVNADSSSQQSKAPASVTVEPSTLATSSAVPTGPLKELTSVHSHADAAKRETAVKSHATRDVQKHSTNRGHSQPSHQHQVGVQPMLSAPQERSDSSEVKMREGVSQTAKVSQIITDAAPSDASGVDFGTESSSHSSEIRETPSVVNEAAKNQHAKQNDIPRQEEITREPAVTKERGAEELSGVLQSENLKAVDAVKTDQDGESKKVDRVGVVVEASPRKAESATSATEGGKQPSASDFGSSTVSNSSNVSDSSASLEIKDGLSCKDYDASKSSISDNEAVSADLSEVEQVGENTRPSSSSGSTKSSLEPNKTKNNRGKKKLKELLQKADAQGTTSDLYMAYKGPEEKKESVVATEVTSESNSKKVFAGEKMEESTRKNKDEQSKAELDDWEDAADISTPKLESSGKGDSEDGVTGKKYSRDFLLTFSDQCKELPLGFEITSDIADALMGGNINASRGNREFSSPGRIVDRSAGAARVDRRGNGTLDADRWSKVPGPYPAGRDPGMDIAYGNNVMGVRGGAGPNFGVLRHPRAQGSVQHVGGILSGPIQSMGFQGVQRNNSDADRWQRATNFNRGLMPAPQTPLQVMHKADRKYEVGKVSDEEEAKQRRLKGILNKLTPQNFEKLFEQVKEVNIDNAITLTGVISQIFDKALMEPTFCEMYANFCFHLAAELPDLSVDNEKITFKRLLLNKCQEEFERGEREEQEANEADGEGETKQSEEEREEKRLKARRRMLGNIRLIGELYKKRMLTERIMHECIKKLLGQYQNPDEENIEALCKLMSTIGEMIDHPKAKEHMDAYFDIMGQLSNNMKLSSRVRFMLRDSIDLRRNKWQQRRKVEGPKKIEEVHRDAAQERQGQAGRLSRGPSMNSAMRRGQPLEFAPRGSMLSSPLGQGGSFRGMPTQVRGYAMQDARMDERNVFESRPLSVPLRSSGDEPITLGPQGGLARGMAFRGQPSVSSSPLLDTAPSYGDPRRMGGGLNGYNTAPDRGAFSSREDHFARHASERFGGPVAYDQSTQELNAGYMNRDARYPDRNVERSRPTTPVARSGVSPAQNTSSEKVWPEERLRDMSMAAIKEYYSAKDEKEVALCLKDLNAPSFYPTVVSIWVTDSFERKDLERDMLAKLLVNLAKPREGTFSPNQLIEGFESVLTNLEDTVNDAPRAPEFLGRIFGKVILENVLPLKEVGRLIHQGGEEPGSLLQGGLGADVLGNVLETIKSEKGEAALNEIRGSSNLRLEDFRPPDPIRSRKLEMFL